MEHHRRLHQRCGKWLLACLAMLASGGCSEELPRPTPSAFRMAAEKGDLATVRTAVERGVLVNGVNEEGATPLMMAAFNGHTDVVQYLLAHGAKVDQRDQMNRTALLYAASGPNSDAVRALLEAKADINAVDGGEGWTALMFAAAEGQADVVRVLLEHGAKKELRDTDGETAQDFAAKNGHEAVAKLLEAK